MTTICRHIHTNGKRCGSPALREQTYCYYHRSLRTTHSAADPANREPVIITSTDGGRDQIIYPTPRLTLPALEDRESIQVALSLIIGALARNDLDSKRATTLLYGLQVASSNAANLDHQPDRDHVVTETTLDESGTELAPDEDPKHEVRRRDFAREWAEAIERGDFDEDEEDDEGEDDEEDEVD